MESSDKLLPKDLEQFWTEHSPRPVIPTAAQQLECPKELVDNLGRWCPTGADDYSRTYRIAVGKIQKAVINGVRNSDPRLCEADVLDRVSQLEHFSGLLPERAAELRAYLEKRMNDFQKELKKAAIHHETDEVICMPLPEIVGCDAESQGIGAPASEATASGSADKAEGPKFLLVFSRQRKHAKLHRVGGCQWVNVTLNDARYLDRVLPSMYDSRCKLCWPKLADVDLTLQGSDESDVSEL